MKLAIILFNLEKIVINELLDAVFKFKIMFTVEKLHRFFVSFGVQDPVALHFPTKILLFFQLFDKIDPEKLTLESHFFKDLGLDSLDHVEIIHMLEEEFMFEFPDDDWERLFTPKDIQQYVCDRYDVFH